MGITLFPVAGYWWLYLAFTGLVVVLLEVDLAFHRKDRVIMNVWWGMAGA